MPVVKYRQALERIRRKPVFTAADLRDAGLPQPYGKNVLHRLAATGAAKRIERGKYTCSDDPIAVAPHITQPCYLSLWTALSIRGLTTQVPFAVEVVTSRRRFARRVEFEGTPIVFYTVDPRFLFGFEHIVWQGGVRIPVANAEKAVIDILHLRRMPRQELLAVIKRADPARLKRYAALTGDARIVREVGDLCSRRKK